MKVTADLLRQAGHLAFEIEELRAAHTAAEDAVACVHVGVPQSASSPMGSISVSVVVSANDIRAKLVEQMTPLYEQLRQLGFELE